MTISEANAANVIAREIATYAAKGIRVSPELETAVATLLINANKRLGAGASPERFLAHLANIRNACPVASIRGGAA